MSIEERIRHTLKKEAGHVETSPDLKRNILYKIDLEKGGIHMKKKRWIAGIAAAIIMVPVTAYAATQAWELFNKDGVKVFEYGALEEKTPQATWDQIDSVRTKLQPGQAVAVYLAGANHLFYTEQPLVYKKPADLHERIGDFATFPQKLQRYSFSTGDVFYQLKNDAEFELRTYPEMKAEAEAKQQNLLVRDIEHDTQLARVIAHYGEGEEIIHLNVSNFSKLDEKAIQMTSSEYNNETKEKVTVAGHEVLYTAHTGDNGNLIKSLHWVVEGAGGKRLYELRTNAVSVGKEELVGMVAEIK